PQHADDPDRPRRAPNAVLESLRYLDGRFDADRRAGDADLPLLVAPIYSRPRSDRIEGLGIAPLENFQPQIPPRLDLWEQVLIALRTAIVRGELPAGRRLVEL